MSSDDDCSRASRRSTSQQQQQQLQQQQRQQKNSNVIISPGSQDSEEVVDLTPLPLPVLTNNDAPSGRDDDANVTSNDASVRFQLGDEENGSMAAPATAAGGDIADDVSPASSLDPDNPLQDEEESLNVWAMHMQRQLTAKDNEIRFLRQELDRANRQLQMMCRPPRTVAKKLPAAMRERPCTSVPGQDGTMMMRSDPTTPRISNGRSVFHNMKLKNKKPKTEERMRIDNEVIVDPFGEKGTYTGKVLKATHMPHGTGRMVYEGEQRVYLGHWKNGHWHGIGHVSFANGDCYEGDYQMDQRHGHGLYRWQDGRVYDGQFRNDRRNGEGVFTWPDGSVYEGEFVDGQREGQGTYMYNDGNRYSGGWKAGKFHGYGALSRADGSSHCGIWKDGIQHGKGTETNADGTIRHDGDWVDGEPSRDSDKNKKRPGPPSSDDDAEPTEESSTRQRRRESSKKESSADCIVAL